MWQIPDEAEKPVDGRVSSGKYVKKAASAEMKSLPIGISDYIRTQSEYYYVDKTLLIKEFLDQKPLVSLFTRPRRFGKTMAVTMLAAYYSCGCDSRELFAGFKIESDETFEKHLNQYDVIYLNMQQFLIEAEQGR